MVADPIWNPSTTLHLNTVPPDPTCIALRLEIPAIVAPPPTTSPLVTNPTFSVERVEIPVTCKF